MNDKSNYLKNLVEDLSTDELKQLAALVDGRLNTKNKNDSDEDAVLNLATFGDADNDVGTSSNRGLGPTGGQPGAGQGS